MWKWLKRFVANSASSNQIAARLQSAGLGDGPKTNNADSVIYPPLDPGLPVKLTGDLLANNADILRMLKLHAAETSAMFDVRFAQPLLRAAHYVNVLPGSATSAFSGAGGLLRAGVETAFYSFRASDGRIFTGSSGVEERHKLEVRWRYVCFLAGLIYPFGGALKSMSVLSPVGLKWSSEMEACTDWANAVKADRLYVTWLTEDARLGPAPLAATFALSIIGRENLTWLNEGSPDLVSSILNIVTSSTECKEAIAAKTVREVWTSVFEREMSRRHQNYGRLTVGSHVTPYLLDALIGLSKSKWVMNETTLYADVNGVYLEWPVAGLDVIEFCKAKGYPGIPENEAALLSVFAASKVVVEGVSGMALVEIVDQQGEIRTAVQLAKPGLLLSDDETLESFASKRPVTLEKVRAQDPLASLKKAPSASGSQIPPAHLVGRVEDQGAAVHSAKVVAPQLEKLDIASLPMLQGQESDDLFAVEKQNQMPRAVSSPAPVPEVTQEGGVTAKKPSSKDAVPVRGGAALGAVVEAPEIRYASLLPADVATKFRPFEAELLGQLVHVWRSGLNQGRVVRMCEGGAAFELKLLADFTKDPVTFLTSLGQQGFLYTASATPAKMVYQVPVTEGGGKTVECFILAQHAVKRLGIQ